MKIAQPSIKTVSAMQMRLHIDNATHKSEMKESFYCYERKKMDFFWLTNG